jgi:putative nucleotidyltransferase with HDIG domain
MPHRTHLSGGGYTYIAAVMAAGFLAVGHSLFVLAVHPVSHQWVILAALTLLTGSFSVKVPSIAARISVSEAFVFAAVLLYGPAAATAIVALDSLVMSMWFRRDQRFGIRSFFNLAAVAVAMWIAGTTFYWLVHIEPGNLRELFPLERRLWQLFALAAIYFLLNSWLVAGVLAFARQANVITLWWQNFPWFSLNYFGGVSVAALMVSYSRSVDLSAIGIILPLLLISYLTYRTSLGRMEDATRHVDHVNALYMSTIETLAMAVDAKDQITHGHIRRVQVYTVELAKRLGVKDKQQLQAIAAAALLHDMGKLAIPEHILNKPGKLTPTEFDKMKRHADIGADLLSSIKFPYPVVPIVRHHHEFWNGGGYPTGIAGTDIPLGARILSVVDCFDALTSDRPYRPRLSASEAFDILRERRGTMYDPLIVDTFIAAHSEIAPAAAKAGEEAPTLIDVSGLHAAEDHSALKRIRSNASETALLNEFDRRLSSTMGVRDSIELAADFLRQLTPATIFAFYRCSTESGVLTCECSVGDEHRMLEGLKIPLGERVTGWTAVNRRTSVNSHAVLDLSNLAEAYEPPLQSTLSSPISRSDDVIGVLSAYSTRENAFSETHRYALEYVAASLSTKVDALRRSAAQTLVAFPGSRMKR